MAKKRAPVVDDVLGELKYSDDDETWVATVKVAGKPIGFQLGGDSEPAAALIARAREIVSGYAAFEAQLRSFLAAEATRLSPMSDEVRALEVEDVCLFWPERPNDGMIYFRSPDEYRVWRCDYIDRRPTDLGFDD